MEVGLLGQLALRQEEYRGILLDIREEESDKGFMDATHEAANRGLAEDQLIAVATVRYEMEDYAEPTRDELIWAGELIDHLDTLGWKLERK